VGDLVHCWIIPHLHVCMDGGAVSITFEFVYMYSRNARCICHLETNTSTGFKLSPLGDNGPFNGAFLLPSWEGDVGQGRVCIWGWRWPSLETQSLTSTASWPSFCYAGYSFLTFYSFIVFAQAFIAFVLVHFALKKIWVFGSMKENSLQT